MGGIHSKTSPDIEGSQLPVNSIPSRDPSIKSEKVTTTSLSNNSQIDLCNHAVASVTANGAYGLILQKGNINESDNTLNTGCNFMVVPSKRVRKEGSESMTPGNTQCSLAPNHVDHGKFLYIVT